jgi:hypothetical protein
MTSIAAKYISKRILGESAANKFGKEDPYFETVPATRLDGSDRPSSKKGKKRRKALPHGISEHDGKVLTKVKRRAYRLDMSLFNCCGIRFGWSSVIGIVPGFGDALDAFMALMVFRTCTQVEGGLPANVKSKMIFNIILDFAVGLVPFLGDIADALFRANTRNAVELEKYLRKKGAQNLEAAGQRKPSIDPSDPEEFDRQMTEQHGPPPGYTEQSSRPSTQHSNAQGRSATAQQERPAEGKGGWFNKSRQPDLERGHEMTNNDPSVRNKSTLQKSRN